MHWHRAGAGGQLEWWRVGKREEENRIFRQTGRIEAAAVAAAIDNAAAAAAAGTTATSNLQHTQGV